MADRSSDARPSASSTRRSSDASLNEAMSSSQHDSRNTSVGNSSLLQDSGRRRPHAVTSQTEGYGTMSRHSTIPSTDLSQSRSIKPPHLRRISSQVPYKGQNFSVDDGEDEIARVNRLKKLENQAKLATGSKRSTATLRRRTTAVPMLAKVPSRDDEDDAMDAVSIKDAAAPNGLNDSNDSLEGEEQVEAQNEAAGDDPGEVSDAESFTLKDRQEAINVTHPFGIRIWKPALYKKNRSVQKSAEDEIHSTPGLNVHPWIAIFNFVWTILFGWWLSILCLIGALLCLVFGILSKHSVAYSRVLVGLARYLFFPFGKFVKLAQDEAYAEEDEGEGRSISEYEQWQSGDIEEGRLFFGPMSRSLIGQRRTSVDSTDETQSLLGRQRRGDHNVTPQNGQKTRLFGRGKWNIGRVIFFVYFHLVITPFLLLVCLLCWFMVFSIPMGKVTWLVWDHLRRHPLALSFHSQSSDTRRPGEPPSSILVCTYRAVGSKYWKFTIDGTNIFLFNLLVIVAFTIFDYYVLTETLRLDIFLTNQGLQFCLALFSIIPLAYFIGQAVASISAQSSMGVGATVNAFFSTIVEVFLYCVALSQGKSQLVEGSIIGSILAGVLFLPGLSMCFGALKRKTQRFNVKSAGVTSTMMLFAMIGAFGPTLFYQIYGSHELKCHECKHQVYDDDDRDCRRCFFSQIPAVHDRFYAEAVLPYIWISATALFLSYIIGLLFTLRTHAAIIWSTEADEKRAHELSLHHATHSHSAHTEPPGTLTRQATASTTAPMTKTDIRDTQLYQRIMKQTGLQSPEPMKPFDRPMKSPHIVPPRAKEPEAPALQLDGLSEADTLLLTRQMAEMAATAAVVATRDVSQKNHYRKPTGSLHSTSASKDHRTTKPSAEIEAVLHPEAAVNEPGGHDAPNWSKMKSFVILLMATLAYAIIAEILVNTVDVVLENVAIDQKFLGITLFALVPNTTEFLNAISFAMNGNIALSMEIGSAYVLQVCLLQVPALVMYSALHGRFINPNNSINYIFTLIFPQWDMVTVILCIFLLSYVYGEGKSNYFKGSILILAYFVVIAGFWFASFDLDGSARGVSTSETLAVGNYAALRGMTGSKGFQLHSSS